MKNAKWEMIKGYEDRYMVSDDGRVWSLISDMQLKLSYDRNGYKRVNLIDSKGKRKTCQVHRLVATAFCEQAKGMNIVNHLNMIKDDNRACNLEWTDHQGNSRHAYDNCEKYREVIENNRQRATQATTDVIEIYHNGNLFGIVEGQSNAAELLGISRQTIYQSIKLDRETMNGYSFERVGDALAYNFG